MPHKIMLVDDEPANLRLLERLFRRDYQVLTASSGMEALHLLEQHDVALLITDQRMPGMSGIELLKRTADLRPHMVRIILTGYTDISSLVEAINCGQVYKYVTKPWSNEDLRQTVGRAIEHYETTKARHELVFANERLGQRLQEMTQGFVRAIADALDAKDDYVHGHARRVSGYSTAIGRRLKLEASLLEQLQLAALLHDIGKIGTPDHILLKPAPLTAQERAVMQLHSERGARMLAGISEMHEVAAAVRHHHERFDGTGYPEGLYGEQIPLAARIIAVADAYDAMTSPRPFREALDHEAALQLLESGAGTQFDPLIVRAFSDFEAISQIRRSISAGHYGARLSIAPLASRVNEFTFNELVREIESEPVLAACVLRAANTGFNEAPTAKLQEACERLGDSRLRSIIERNCLHDEHSGSPKRLWEHSLRCAASARLLAEQTAVIDPDDAYTLGLLHDTGEILFRSLFPAEMDSMQHLTGDERELTEVVAFGVDHAQVGQWILESCGVPRLLTVPVQTHHDVMRMNDPAALLLHVANAVARADDAYKVTALDALGSDRLALMGLSRADLASVHKRTAAAIEQQELIV
ncbi:MAG TPA: HD domain-containing phosphohydrolase [Pyrinomonadaceae bacterium]|jgi:putative nucleotidyltransferase with HDIG domain